MGATLCKIGAEAVSANVFHLMLVRERGNSVCGELLAKGFVKEYEVGEAASDAE